MRLGVRGWGSVSALGADTASALRRMRRGERGLALPEQSPHLVALPTGPVLVGEAPVDAPLERRARVMVELAVEEALRMAGPSSGRVGVFVGTTGGYFVEGEFELHEARKLDPGALPTFGLRGPGEVGEHVAGLVGATGPVLTWSMACTSSAAALAAAGAHLRAGTCERAVVVGFDLLSSLTLHGFRALMLVDPQPSRPFDATRAGLQLGEGAGVLVVDAQAEAPFLLLGADNVLDPSHLTASATDGSTAEQVIRGALRDSGRGVEQVVSVKAHGTGTRDNDLAEGRGLARVFGDSGATRGLPFASLKGALGHTLGAAGAIEVALWLAALSEGFLPASVGFTEQDPEIGLSPLTESVPAPRGVHLFDAFGFGGSCVALAVEDA